MPSKRIYEIQFNKESNGFGIQVTDEFRKPQPENNFKDCSTIEEARALMDELKKEVHDRTIADPFSEIVYISPSRFEIIHHR